MNVVMPIWFMGWISSATTCRIRRDYDCLVMLLSVGLVTFTLSYIFREISRRVEDAHMTCIVSNDKGKLWC